MKKFVLFVAVALLLVACKSKCVDCDVEMPSEELSPEQVEAFLALPDTASVVVMTPDSLFVEPEMFVERDSRAGDVDVFGWALNITVVVGLLLLAVLAWLLLSAGGYRKRTMSESWVDLGLPSGRLWKSVNEDDTYTFDEAVEKFGDELPSAEDWKELFEHCMWIRVWIRKGVVVAGPNGKSIFFPAGKFYDKKFRRKSIFWSSTDNGDKESGRVICISRREAELDAVSKKSNKLNVRLCNWSAVKK